MLGITGVCTAGEPADPDHRPSYTLSVDGSKTLTLACGFTVPKIRDARGYPLQGMGLRRSHPCEDNTANVLELWRADQFVAAWRDPGTNVVTLLKLSYPFPYEQEPRQRMSPDDYLCEARVLATNRYQGITSEHVQGWLNYYYQGGSTGAAPFQAVSMPMRMNAIERCSRYDVDAEGQSRRVYVFKLREHWNVPDSRDAWFALEVSSGKMTQQKVDAFAADFLGALAVKPAALAAERDFWEAEPSEAFARANAVRGVRNLGGEWRVYHHGGFTLITDNPAVFDSAEAGLEAQQRAYDLFPNVLFPFGPASLNDVCVIRVYATGWEFEDSVPATRKWAGGMYMPGSDEIVMRGWSREGTVHEITHRYLHVASGNRGLSTWFNEGFACYFSGCKVSEDRLVAAPVDSRHLLLQMIAKGELSTVADVFSVEDFYLDKESKRDPKDPIAGLKRAKNYTAAWGVIYFLREASARYPGKGYETLIPLYWDTLQRTGDPNKATEAVLGNMRMTVFLADFKEFFLSFAKDASTTGKRRRRTEPVYDLEHPEFMPRDYLPDFSSLAPSDGATEANGTGLGRPGLPAQPRGDNAKAPETKSWQVREGRRIPVRDAEAQDTPRDPRKRGARAVVMLVIVSTLVCGWRLLKNGKWFVLALLLSTGRLFGEVAETNSYAFIFRVVGGGVELGDGSGCAVSPKPKGELIVPPTFAGRPVVAIGSYALINCEAVTRVKLPETIERIGEGAFYGCRKLKTVDLPVSVTHIGPGAFFLCASLEEVNLPPRLTVVPDWAFGRCFRLSSVTFGNAIGRIGSNAFVGCAALTDVRIPRSVADIGEQAFKWCSGLQSVEIAGPVTTIRSEMFAGCSNLRDMMLPKTVRVIENCAFQWCRTLEKLTIPEGVAVIESRAFQGCHRLASIDLPDTLSEIGHDAFSECLRLTRIDFGRGLSVIESHAFRECHSLTSITFPVSLRDIRDSAFSRCPSLFSVTLPSSLKSVGRKLFSECANLSNVTLPPSILVIGEAAFEKCANLSSITLPDSVSTLDPSAFADCSNLWDVDMGTGLTKIGRGAFRGCSKLQTIEFPASLISIGGKVFEKCVLLSRVYFAGGAPSAKRDVYEATPDNLTSYYRPGTKGWGKEFGGRPTAVWKP